MRPRAAIPALFGAATLWGVLRAAAPDAAVAERLTTASEVGRRGGRVAIALRTEPKTLNPVTAVDNTSRDVLARLHANLVAIDRHTQRTVPALAKSWTVSPDGRRYTVELRRGLRFSDGDPFDADDVVFSFECYLDPRNGSPQRDLLIVGGQPIAARKLGPYRVALELAQPYAVGDRLFDGIAILPSHRLAQAQREGRLAKAWALDTPGTDMAGLGPFRLKAYVPGQRIVLERNPHYWKKDGAGQALPYLDELVFLSVASEDAEVIRFRAGETDLLTRVNADNFAALQREAASRFVLYDLGPGLEYAFLLFNLNELGSPPLEAVRRRQQWFADPAFRRAVSLAADRRGMARLAYQGRATPLGTHVTPGNRLWVNEALKPPTRSPAAARELLRAAGFSWNADGSLVDRGGTVVEFTIVTNAGNATRVKLATVLEDDLRQLGMRARLVPIENRALLDRVFQTHDYDTAVMALASGDVDPNSEMNVWLSSGPTHLWRLGQRAPATAWEGEIDELMRRQLVTLDPRERKRAYDRVQELAAEHLPIVPLVSPNVLVAAREGLGNLRPAVLDHALLWNAEELFWRGGQGR